MRMRRATGSTRRRQIAQLISSSASVLTSKATSAASRFCSKAGRRTTSSARCSDGKSRTAAASTAPATSRFLGRTGSPTSALLLLCTCYLLMGNLALRLFRRRATVPRPTLSSALPRRWWATTSTSGSAARFCATASTTSPASTRVSAQKPLPSTASTATPSYSTSCTHSPTEICGTYWSRPRAHVRSR
jgi:hypothetical protein